MFAYMFFGRQSESRLRRGVGPLRNPGNPPAPVGIEEDLLGFGMPEQNARFARVRRSTAIPALFLALGLDEHAAASGAIARSDERARRTRRM